MIELNLMMEEFIQQHPFMFLGIIIWSLIWKGFALWKAARLNNKWWFVALLILNTVGILEIFYLFIFSKKVVLSKDKQEIQSKNNGEV